MDRDGRHDWLHAPHRVAAVGGAGRRHGLYVLWGHAHPASDQSRELLALAWLVVVAVNPTDPFTAGCQLSFLSVFVLIWGDAVACARRQRRSNS